MARGRVKRWFAERGTGFLTDASDGIDVFFGDRELRGLTPAEVAVGMEVEFERRQGDKGPRATNVRRSGAAAPPAGPGIPGSGRQPPRPVRDEPTPLNEPPIPRVFLATVNSVRIEDRHPGLQLDRLVIPGNQERQRESLLDSIRAAGDRSLFAETRKRRESWFKSTGTDSWVRVTAGPLTLHLARANALENAGLCLHPVYGFPYLPGSGLKGLARAYATETACADKRDILAVFGNEPGAGEKDGQHAGAVVFHDAWPADWPTLTVDITNNHHPKYYQGEDAPGDWDSPVPVYFLAIAPGSTFEFALARRRDDGAGRLLELARKWLDEALTTAGAGAKTAAGYGSFIPQETRSPAGPNRAEAVVELELVTPAFLGGALPEAATDCTLRTATLRGHLRWWWRTMHAGFLTVEELRALEAAVWGDTASGSAVRVELVPKQSGRVSLYSHPQERQSGTRYLAYGMDEKSRGERRQRFLMTPGATWDLRLTTRRTCYHPPAADPRRPPPPITLTKEQVLEQVHMAVWLLARFGGVGSKGRKGFGSLAAIGRDLPTDLERCHSLADLLRRETLGIAREFDPGAESAALADPDLQVLEIRIPDRDPFQAIERVGRAYASVAAQYKHNDGKSAWGLPRKIHGPTNQPLPHQSAGAHQPPEWLDFPKRPPSTRPENARHAAPIHLHLDKDGGGYVVRLLALPARYLRSRAESVGMLQAFAVAFRTALGAAAPAPAGPRAGAARPPAPARPDLLLVEVLLLERMEKSGPNAFRVQEEGRPKGMLVSGTPPSPLPEVGAKIHVYRETGSDPRSPRYRWDARLLHLHQPGQVVVGARKLNRRNAAMLIVNFSHPLTPEQIEQIGRLAGGAVERVIDVKTQLDPTVPFTEQVRWLVEQVGLSRQEWQTSRLLVNPPSLAAIACLVLAELHGRAGYFPTVIRLRPRPGANPPVYEVAELLALQQVRDAARAER